MTKWLIGGMLALSLALPAGAAEAGSKDLAKPVRVEAAGKPIDIGGVGHSAPFVGDVDGDGKFDLLIGTFSGGVCRIYRNVGTNKMPRFDKFDLLLDGKAEGTVPTG